MKVLDGGEREAYWHQALIDGRFYEHTFEQQEEILKDIIRLAFDENPDIRNTDKECPAAVRRDKFITIEKTHSIKNVRIECGWWNGFVRSIKSWF